MKFIHLSDLHFHSFDSDNKGIVRRLEYIRQNPNYSSHNLIITGDIVDDGHERQYVNAYEALQPFLGRVFICPGNHDFGAAGNFFSKERAERFDAMLAKPLQQGGTFTGDSTPVVNILRDVHDTVMLIGLDTNLETDHPFDFACGEVGESQLGFLKTILASPASAGMLKIVFFHHHPFMHKNPFMELKDGRQLMRTLYGRVDMVLFGHKHVADKWENLNGIKYVLAANNTYGNDFAQEIVIAQGQITVTPIPII